MLGQADAHPVLCNNDSEQLPQLTAVDQWNEPGPLLNSFSSPFQVSIPLWALVHLPVVVTLSTAAFTPNGWVHSILYVLFENAMGIVKLGAVIAGRGLPDLSTGLCLGLQLSNLHLHSECHSLAPLRLATRAFLSHIVASNTMMQFLA